MLTDRIIGRVGAYILAQRISNPAQVGDSVALFRLDVAPENPADPEVDQFLRSRLVGQGGKCGVGLAEDVEPEVVRRARPVDVLVDEPAAEAPALQACVGPRPELFAVAVAVGRHAGEEVLSGPALA